MCCYSTVVLDLKPYLKEYVLNNLMDENGVANDLLMTIIKPHIKRIPKEGYIPEPFVENERLIQVKIPSIKHPYSYDGGVYIPKRFLSDIRVAIFYHFKDKLFQYLDDKIRYNREIKLCIYDFCSFYKINQYGSVYETFKKQYYRHEKKLQNISSKSVPKSSLRMSLKSTLIFLL